MYFDISFYKLLKMANKNKKSIFKNFEISKLNFLSQYDQKKSIFDSRINFKGLSEILIRNIRIFL